MGRFAQGFEADLLWRFRGRFAVKVSRQICSGGSGVDLPWSSGGRCAVEVQG
jgi:hypothetical protein